MTIDANLVTRKLVLISADLATLRTIHAKEREDYVSNVTSQAVAERLLERIVTRMIDINYHLITATGAPPPSDYHASFQQLARIGVLDVRFATRVAGAAGLRNRLVHDYDDLDHQLIFAALAQALTDVPAYVAAVHSFVENASGRSI